MSFFGLRPGFELSALVVSWVAIAFLTLIVANLHSRLRVVEAQRGQGGGGDEAWFAHLLGRRLGEVIGRTTADVPRVLILLSSSCPSCERLLDEMRTGGWREPAAIGWIDGPPSPPPEIPGNATLLDDGPRIGRELGVRLTPFALVADAAGRVAHAAPLNDLEDLHRATVSPEPKIEAR